MEPKVRCAMLQRKYFRYRRTFLFELVLFYSPLCYVHPQLQYIYPHTLTDMGQNPKPVVSYDMLFLNL